MIKAFSFISYLPETSAKSEKLDMTSKISGKDCIKILQNYLPNSKDVKFISYEFKSISENVEGFAGDHLKLIITYEEENEKKSQAFFVKNKPSSGNIQQEMSDVLDLYIKEIFVYDILLKEFEKYGYDTSFAAKSYYSIPNETLVMEDVTLKGFSTTDRSVSLTKEHLKCALKSLALYHAGGYALERTKSKELNKTFILGDEYGEYMKEYFFSHYRDRNDLCMNWWKGTAKTVNILVDLLPQNNEFKEDLKELLKNSENGKAFATKTKINKTCGHGDLWSNNMLFKYKNNIPVQCCLIDFQVIRYFYPSFDVLLSIYFNTDSQFRKTHLEELLLYYHKTLSVILKNYRYNIEDIYSLEDFYESIDLIKVEALMQNLLTSIIVLLPKNQTDGKDVEEILFNNCELAAKAFQSDDSFKLKISEIIYELRQALIERRQKQKTL